jgi:hypothetical protein
MTQMVSRPTRAMATTSVWRMTGGNSLLLSGTGAPSRAWASRRALGEGFAAGDLAAEGLVDEGVLEEGLSGEGFSGEGLSGITLTMASPRPKRR